MQSSVLSAAIAVGVVVWVVVRQMRGRRLVWRTMAGIPILLGYLTWRNRPQTGIPAGDALLLALDVGLAIVCGLWQGTQSQVFRRGDQWYIRGGWRYLVGWVAFLGGDIALHLAVDGPASLAQMGSSGLWVELAGAAAVWTVRAVTVAALHPETLSAPAGAAVPGER